MRKPIIGVAGGIGSGKSTVSRLLAARGAEVICADVVAAAYMHTTKVIANLQEWWGPDIMLDENTLDRERIREITKDPKELDRLSDLVHPHVKEVITTRTQRLQEEGKCAAIVWDIPLLFEKGYADACDMIIFVDASPEIRLNRVREVRGWSEEDFNYLESRQSSLITKKEFSTVILDNNGDDAAEDLERQVNKIEFRVRLRPEEANAIFLRFFEFIGNSSSRCDEKGEPILDGVVIEQSYGPDSTNPHIPLSDRALAAWIEVTEAIDLLRGR